jgi:hypothetical protein
MEVYFSIFVQHFSNFFFTKMKNYLSKQKRALEELNSHPPVAGLELIHPTKASDEN